jgi:hypothetical protein
MSFSSEVVGGRSFYGRARSAVNTSLGKMQTYFQLVLHFQCFAPLANFDHPSGIKSLKVLKARRPPNSSRLGVSDRKHCPRTCYCSDTIWRSCAWRVHRAHNPGAPPR